MHEIIHQERDTGYIAPLFKEIKDDIKRKYIWQCNLDKGKNAFNGGPPECT